MELFKAHNQWKNRPADQRFWNLQELLEATAYVKAQAVEADSCLADLRVTATDDNLLISGRQGKQAILSNFAFGQLSARIGAPASYLRDLPATLAAQNLNYGLKATGEEIAKPSGENDTRLLFHRNGDFVLRAATSTSYARVWNHTLVKKLMGLVPEGFRVPCARPVGIPGERTRKATELDVMRMRGGGLSVNVGDDIAPAGLYASDKDIFVFLVNEEATIDDGTDTGLAQGFFLWNSEVGDKSLGGMVFDYKSVCGNHIVWGAQDVFEFNYRHVGNVEDRAQNAMEMFVKKYSNASVSDREGQIVKARSMVLGKTKDEVVDAVLAFVRAKKVAALNKKLLEAAYDAADLHADWYGNPRSVYGMVNGITEVSQVDTHTDERTEIDRAAGKVMTMAF